MKILIYGEFFLPVVGGVQTSMNLLAKGLVEMNSRPGQDDVPGQIEVTVVTRTTANGTDDSVFPYPVVRRPKLWRLVQLIRNADVIHVAGPCLLPLAISWLLGKAIVVEHHGYQAICPNGLLLRQPSQTVCPGHFVRREYMKCVRCCSVTEGGAGAVRSFLLTFVRFWFGKRVAANITITNHVATRLKLPRMQTVYYGIEEPGPMSTEGLQIASKRVEMAYVGRLVPEKGLPVLLHAAENLKHGGVPFNLRFIGDGPERRTLEELADRLGIRDFVQFMGDLRGSNLDRAVSDVAMVVMPSVWEETAGLSAIEQMMRGRVVIVADIGGLSEVVGDAGLKFPPGDSQALAACLRRVIENPILVKSFGSMARERAMRLFSLGSMIKGHVSLYSKVWHGEMQKRDAHGAERHTEV